jgi:heterodisulfide reductase subunit E
MIISQTTLWIIFGVCLFLFCLGFLYRVSIWMEGMGEDGAKKRSKIFKFLQYKVLFCKALFSRKAPALIKSFFADGIVHGNLLKDSMLKWLIHMFMFWGLASFTLITILHVIAIAAAPNNIIDGSAPWFVMVFGTLENRFTALVIDLSKLAILGGAFIAVLRFMLLKKKYKSVELKDKSAGVIISIIAIFSFIYEAIFFLAKGTPAARAAFAPAGYVLSLILNLIPGVNWSILAAIFFYAYITALFIFCAYIPYGKYSHMVFGPIVAVYNKLSEGKH